MAAHLVLVADGGQLVEPRATETLSVEAGSDPRAVAFLMTMELALRQASRLLDSPDQPARLRRLCQSVLSQTHEVLALTSEDAEWGIEPFVGA